VKILIIRFSSIGDIVLTTPVVRCLKKQLPDVKIHFLTKTKFVEVLHNNPYLDRIYHIDENISEVISTLKKENYDLIVDLHKNIRSTLIKLLLLKPTKTFNKLSLRKIILCKFHINLLPNIHIVDRYLNTVSYLNIKNDFQGLDFFNIKEDYRLPFDSNDYISFAIGAKHFTKCLPSDKIIEICKNIKDNIILIGGDDEREKGDYIISKCSNALNMCGKLSLSETAKVIKHSKLVITHDTGIMHIAAALNKKIISIWGNTVPEFGMYPYMKKNGEQFIIIEKKNLNCRPCSRIGYKSCPKNHFKCMNEIKPTDIIDNLNKLIS